MLFRSIVRRLLSVHLELGKPTVDFFEPTFVVIDPPVLGDPKVESPDESEREADGVRGRFSFLTRSSWEGEGRRDRWVSHRGRLSPSLWEC